MSHLCIKDDANKSDENLSIIRSPFPLFGSDKMPAFIEVLFDDMQPGCMNVLRHLGDTRHIAKKTFESVLESANKAREADVLRTYCAPKKGKCSQVPLSE